MLKVFFDTSPLSSGHAHRGVGSYTRQLKKALEKNPTITLLKPQDRAQADLVHIPFFDFFSPTLKIDDKPTVVTIHDAIPLQFPQQYPVGPRGKFALLKQRWAVQQTKKIITDSHASAVDLSRYFWLPPSKIAVVHLAAGSEFKRAATSLISQTKKKYHLPEKYILYVGDINYNKNLPALISSLNYLNDEVQLVLVGRNMKPQAISEWRALQTAIDRNDLAGRVHFLSDVTTVDELTALYSAAAVYVQPSLVEGFGLPILEALHCQTPVVVYDHSAMSEIGGDAVIKAPFAQVEALSSAIAKVLGWTNKQRAAQVKKGKEWASRFSWEKTAQETIAVYQGIL